MRAHLTAAATRHPIIAYALLTYTITWMLVLPLALNGLGVTHLALPAGWHAVGDLGPITAAFLVTVLTQRRPGVARLLASMRRWRIGWVWWVVALPC